MPFTDVIIGALVVNAMPHLIFGLTKTHFLGMFGYGPKGNITYAILQFVLCIILFCSNYGFEALLENGFLVGALTVLLLYFIFGKNLVGFYGKQDNTTPDHL
jgi:NO-binding membrane sensor protein with MHYT domain